MSVCGSTNTSSGDPCQQPVAGPNETCWREGHVNKGGRPRIQLTDDQLELLENLASIGLTQAEAAKVLPMCERTLRNRLQEGNNDVSAVYERARGRYHEQVSKRERWIAFGDAEKLNVDEVPVGEQRKTLRWIRKSRFGASEKQEIEHSGPEGGPIEVDVDDARQKLERQLTSIADRRADVSGPRGNGAGD